MRNLIPALTAMIILGSCSLLVDFEPQKTNQERNCHDDLDNDDDGEIDCADQDCYESPDCTTVNNVNNVVNPEDCFNGQDDNGNGLIDCEDEYCWNEPGCEAQTEFCGNGIDDDRDGDLDCEDEDCRSDPYCAPDELCRNGVDDNENGLVDCEDSACWGVDGCNYPDGETDCGDLGDNDDDGYVDCADDDCRENLICAQELQYCGQTYYFQVGNLGWYYFANLIGEAPTTACPQNHHCTIKRDWSQTPYCYPKPVGSTLAQPYQVCNSVMPCGPGAMCAHSPTLSPLFGNQEVCLPQCAPGWLPACPGTGKVCMFLWDNVWFNPGNVNVEVWLCDQPECDPMSTATSGCNNGLACYPDPSLWGPASCHNSGSLAIGAPCTQDIACVPGAVCRTDDNMESTCHGLCRENGNCTDGGTCHKDDPRQHFGFCR